MRKKSLILAFSPILVALSSCGGYSLGYIVKGNTYNSAVFGENYYTHWDAELKNAKASQNIELNDTDYIVSFDDIALIDDKIAVEDPYADPSKYPTTQAKIRQYSKDQRLMNYDKSFYYGVQSKLFDGESYCDSYYQRHRVQSNEAGFSVRFTKESETLPYFAMQFKSTTNVQKKCYPVGSDTPVDNPEADGNYEKFFHKSVLTLDICLYTKTNEGIVNNKFAVKEIHLDHTNDGGNYTFLGFDLGQYSVTRCVGFSVSFSIVSDELLEWNKNKGITDIDYALFIYEIFMPYTFWH